MTGEERYEYSEHLWITTGVPGDDQESDFMNGTLQGTGNHPELEFTVQTFVGVPAGIVTEAQLREHLRSVLQKAVNATGGTLNFEVQLGPAGSGEDDES